MTPVTLVTYRRLHARAVVQCVLYAAAHGARVGVHCPAAMGRHRWTGPGLGAVPWHARRLCLSLHSHAFVPSIFNTKILTQ